MDDDWSAEDADVASWRQQLAAARNNLRLIEERKAEYVLGIDIPLQFVKEEQQWRDRIAALEKLISSGGKTKAGGQGGYRKVRIFIASPGDVYEERGRVKKVVAELNDTVGEAGGVVLQALDWREHVVPFMGLPQEVTLDQLPVNSWDILVVILWHRFGTPPGGQHQATGEQFMSGTEQEFALAYEFWKEHGRPRIMVYHCIRPVPYDADPLQWQQVKDFLSQFKPDREHPGFVAEYTTPDEFEHKLRKHLTKLLLKGEKL